MELIKEISAGYQEYLKDESRTVGTAETISFPKTENEVIEIIKYLYENNTNITIQGARTGLAAAAVPFGGHILNVSRMDKVLGCRKDKNGDFYFTLQPGIPLLELNKMITRKSFNTKDWSETSLKAYNDFCRGGEYFFSPDPTESTADIGGMVACNASGARSFMYGPTRKHITAIRVVLANGRVISLKRGSTFAKGRTVDLECEDGSRIHLKLPTYIMPETKNASGYYIKDDMDAIDIFIGSDGTLGVISEIEISILKLPESIWGVSCFFENEHMAVKFVEAIRHKIKGIAAIEYFDSNALMLLRHQKRAGTAFSALPEIPENYGCCIYAELHGKSDEDNESRLFEIGNALIKVGGDETCTWVARTQSDIECLHFFRHAVPESANMIIDKRKKENPIITKLGADMSVPDDFLETVISVYREGLEEYALQSATWGHIGDNHLHVNILPENEDDYFNGKELYSKWAQRITSMGGAVSAEHGVGKIKAPFLEVMYGKKHIMEMAELKYSLDPKGLLGNGNLFKPMKGEAGK